MSAPIARVPLRRPTAARWWLRGVTLALLGVTIWALATIDTRGVDLADATRDTVRYFGLMALEPRAVPSHFGASDALGTAAAAGLAVLVTLALSYLTTLIGAPIALLLGLLAAQNLGDARVGAVIRGVMALVRAIPTVLWVLIFAIGAGLGSVAAVIGMAFHTVAQLTKSYAESFEEIDPGVIDALRASGASWWAIVAQAVLPSSGAYLISWTFIRFEVNFGVAVAMGAAAGAGGIGFNLFMSAGYFFDMREVGFITYLLLGVAIAMEWVATRMNHRPGLPA